MGTMGTSGRRETERVSGGDDLGEDQAGVSLQDLQQENESLKELVVSLSELVIKRVAEQR